MRLDWCCWTERAVFVNDSLYPIPYYVLFTYILSSCSPSDPTRFTLHIKSMGEGTWSHALVNKLQQLEGVGVNNAAANSGGAIEMTSRGSRGPLMAAGPVSMSVNGDGEIVSGGGAGAMPLGSRAGWSAGGQATYAGSAIPPYAKQLRGLGPIYVTGPFGRPSLKLSQYSHFLLVAGGIGITPLASLHYALAKGIPVDETDVGWFAAVKRFLCCWGCSGRTIQTAEGEKHFVAGAAPVSSITSVWSVREPGLASTFLPLLVAGTPADDGPTVGADVRATIFTGGSHKDRQAHAEGMPQSQGADGFLAINRQLPVVRERPHMGRIFADVATRLLQQKGREGGGGNTPVVAVLVCGPSALVQSVYAAADAANSGRMPAPGGGGEGASLAAGSVIFNVHRETFNL